MMTPALPCLDVARCKLHFGLSDKTIYKMIDTGELPAVLFGAYVINWADVWACEQGPAPRTALRARYMSDLLSPSHLAALTGRSLSTVDRWLAVGLPTRNVRGSVRVNALDAADWLACHYGKKLPLGELRDHAVKTLVLPVGKA